MMTPEEREEWGYSHYTCRIHGGFWSDVGAHCPYCEEAEQIDGEDETDRPSDIY